MLEPVGSGIVNWDENHPYGQGPVGRALRSGRPCIVRDAQTDPIYAAWRDYPREMGFIATASFPLLVDGKSL
ncbi:MAG: hypothetical protein B6D47_11290, partial [Rhodocyclaceae bacterium UTPRO2]